MWTPIIMGVNLICVDYSGKKTEIVLIINWQVFL